jgi:hypothetical protein
MIASRARRRTEMNEIRGRDREFSADALDHSDQFILHHQRLRLAVLDDVAEFRPGEAKVDRYCNNAR